MCRRTRIGSSSDVGATASVEDVPSAADTDPSSDLDVTADEDDDWPTRYSWLDDEEADEAAESDDVTLPSDAAVAAEVEASDLPKPTSPDASKSPQAKADAETAEAEDTDGADAAHDDVAEPPVSPAAHSALEGTDAADEAPVLSSVTDIDPDPGETEPSAEADSRAVRGSRASTSRRRALRRRRAVRRQAGERHQAGHRGPWRSPLPRTGLHPHPLHARGRRPDQVHPRGQGGQLHPVRSLPARGLIESGPAGRAPLQPSLTPPRSASTRLATACAKIK